MFFPSKIGIGYYNDNLYDTKNLMFNMFQVDLGNFFDIKFILLKHLKCQFSEIEALPYYEYEIMFEKLKEWLEKEKEQRDKEEKDYQEKQSKNSHMRDSESMMKKFGVNPNSLNKHSAYKAPKWK